MLPDKGFKNPQINERRVVLPEPLGPRMLTNSPLLTFPSIWTMLSISGESNSVLPTPIFCSA